MDISTAERPHGSLNDFPVVIALPVQWGDQDAFGHVNNIVYFRWCETARIAYLERVGMWKTAADHSTGPILAAIGCDFRRQVTFPDTVYVGARVTQLGNSSFRMEHRIVSRAADAVAADSDSTLVFFDYRRQEAVPVPEPIRRAISDLEGRTF